MKIDSTSYGDFSEVVDRLDAIVKQVRGKDTSLEHALDLFDEAIVLGGHAVDLVDKIDFTPEERARLDGDETSLSSDALQEDVTPAASQQDGVATAATDAAPQIDGDTTVATDAAPQTDGDTAGATDAAPQTDGDTAATTDAAPQTDGDTAATTDAAPQTDDHA